jgi:hypothetical protein
VSVLQRPVLVALFLMTAYCIFVAVVQAARARKADHALMGAAIFAGLATAATIWT